MSNLPPQRRTEPRHSDRAQTFGQSHSVKVTPHTVSLQFALLHLILPVFTGMAFCGDTLPLGCEQDPSNSNTSAELAGSRLWNISETPRQRDKQTSPHPHPHDPPQNTFKQKGDGNQEQLLQIHSGPPEEIPFDFLFFLLHLTLS